MKTGLETKRYAATAAEHLGLSEEGQKKNVSVFFKAVAAVMHEVEVLL